MSAVDFYGSNQGVVSLASEGTWDSSGQWCYPLNQEHHGRFNTIYLVPEVARALAVQLLDLTRDADGPV